jgi:hypothetical protein
MKAIALSTVLACSALATGCAHHQPLISHAHVGHCLTQWHDTPDNRGLFDVAKAELATARTQADAALEAGLSVSAKSEHLDNVVHALNPDLQPLGPGLDYGAIRALDGAIEHLEYAATSDDASANIVSSVAQLSQTGVAIVERLRQAAEQARGGDRKDALSLDRIALDVRTALSAALAGVDADHNGHIDATAAEAGLEQFHAALDTTLEREANPKYEPLERRYLLGVVRLPNGKWGFLPWGKSNSRPTYGY